MESTTGVTPFRLQANLIVVDVEVNGRPGEFLLDTPLPTIPVVLEHVTGSRVTVQEVESHGLTLEMARASLEGSLAAQVSDFRLLATETRERAGRPTLRIEHRGVSDGVPGRFLTEAVLTDSGLLVLACEAPASGEGGYEGVGEEMETILASLKALATQAAVPGVAAPSFGVTDRS